MSINLNFKIEKTMVPKVNRTTEVTKRLLLVSNINTNVDLPQITF